ncbi:protein MFI [Astyanax mexicanus]|uniref:protein MFI n=1 Tax=Astyanax mexicanus TaxID=7994 RepID=UPI0020CB5E88|nr:protein MFI [Astyanax mexicanus]
MEVKSLLLNGEGNVKYTDLFDRTPIFSPSEGVAQEKTYFQESTQDSVYDRAARVIQRTWRRHVDIAVFKYIKSLVNFRNQGDPRFLLKCVNPREADMLDAASGVYIRFRLGGTTFPPNIYYKIFTHHPIVDLCTSSPRDYTHVGQRRPVPIQIHNGQPVVQDDRSGWYRRIENNSWRLLSGKIYPHGDPTTQNTNNKRSEFHHCRIHRKQDVERKKKIRKIEWMKKMYGEGALHAHTEHKETAQLVENAMQVIMRAVLQQGVDSVLEWEVDELIEWTNALNFDEYLNEWKDLGTSNTSALRKDQQLVLSHHDASEFSQLTRDSSQVFTQSTVLPAQVSSLIKSEYSRENSSDWII